MEQNTNLRKETSGRKPFIKVLVSVLVAALAAFVMLPLTSSMTRQDVMAEETANVIVRKVDEERNLLKDAVLHIEDANGNIVVGEWTSTDLPGGDKKVNLTAGTYYIVEDAAPGGYKKLEDKVEFVVDEPTIITSPTADTDGKPIKLPVNYFPGDDPNYQPRFTWRAHANLLYRNWLNWVYQMTPYRLADIPETVADLKRHAHPGTVDKFEV